MSCTRALSKVQDTACSQWMESPATNLCSWFPSCMWWSSTNTQATRLNYKVSSTVDKEITWIITKWRLTSPCSSAFYRRCRFQQCATLWLEGLPSKGLRWLQSLIPPPHGWIWEAHVSKCCCNQVWCSKTQAFRKSLLCYGYTSSLECYHI